MKLFSWNLSLKFLSQNQNWVQHKDSLQSKKLDFKLTMLYNVQKATKKKKCQSCIVKKLQSSSSARIWSSFFFLSSLQNQAFIIPPQQLVEKLASIWLLPLHFLFQTVSHAYTISEYVISINPSCCSTSPGSGATSK